MLKRLILSLLVLAPASLSLFAGPRRVIRSPEKIQGLYLVVLNEGFISKAQVPEFAQSMTGQHGGAVRLVMNNAASIFSASLSEAQAHAIAQHPAVLSVEEVAAMHPSAVQSLPPPAPLNNLDLWNLDRIDQLGTPNSNAYQFCERASDVIAYVADYGIMGTHQEFQRPDGTSRVRPGVCFASDCFENRGNYVCPSGTSTDYGHGTAVASVLGGRTVGVAKEISIVPLRIFSCGVAETVTTTERFCWALDWIRSADNPDRDHRPALVSLSAYRRANEPELLSFEHVINGLVLNEGLGDQDPENDWTGITVVVSANNQGRSDCVTSPARMAYRNNTTVAQPGFASPGRVISVGGTSRAIVDGVLRDVRWQSPMFTNDPNAYDERCVAADGTGINWPAGSNHGNMVDIYAPADNIDSADTASTTSYRTALKSGTSFSAPLVAGIVARILQVEQTLTPAQVWARVQQYAQHVSTPFDTSGIDQNGNPTSNDLLAIRRYTSATCAIEHP